MKKTDLPGHQLSRLETERSVNLLSTEPEERFDRLTRLACRVFQVPAALLTLVEDRQQAVKSCSGLAIKDLPTGLTFCQHTLRANQVLVVPDTRLDPRFADNPAVSGEPHIVFYAGAPLYHPDGSKLGTLSIVDYKTRQLDEEEVSILQELAAVVESELTAMRLATVDDLTLIYNRRGFLTSAQHSLYLCERQGMPASLVFFDLDNFKNINDTFGHAEGDQALRAFARHLQVAFRGTDIFGRLSGDEFVVLLTNAPRESAEAASRRFRQLLENHNNDNERGYDIKCSYGIVEFQPGRHESIDDLLADGDARMYQAKQASNPVFQ